MKTITLSPLGEYAITRPSLWTGLADLTVSWPTEPAADDFRPRIIRCAAASLGMALPPALGLPDYRPERMDVLRYGSVCLDELLHKGVPLAEIVRAGRLAGEWLTGALPTEQEVVETVDFTEAEEPATLYASESHGSGESIPIGL